MNISNGDKKMVEMVMGNIHIGKSGMYVARYWLTRVKKFEAKKHIKMDKIFKKQLIKYALECHNANFTEYCFVMGGIK